MILPEKNKEVSLPEIKEICVAYGLNELWAKIEKDPPKKPFKSDGCSMWFDERKIIRWIDRSWKVEGGMQGTYWIHWSLAFSLQPKYLFSYNDRDHVPWCTHRRS